MRRQILHRTLIFLIQLAIIVAAVYAAFGLTEWAWLVPEPLRKQSPFTDEHRMTILLVFLSAHGLLLLLSWFRQQQNPLANLHRFGIECYFAMVATSLASCGMFLFTVVPFSANYYAWVYACVIVGYLLLLGAGRLAIQTLAEQAHLAAPPLLRLVFSRWTIIAGILVLSPAFMAGFYKLHTGFSNLVNDVRAEINTDTKGEWVLVPRFPGQTFEQPMYLAFDKNHSNTMLLLSRPGRLYRYATKSSWNEEILLDFSTEVGSIELEMGAYGFATHPEYGQANSPNRGYVYLDYSHIEETGQYNRLARFDISLPTLEERNKSQVLLINLSRGRSAMHHGGAVLFGPKGFLYLSIGDYNIPEKTQQIDDALLGGIFRIDVDQLGGDISAPIKKQPNNGVTANYFIPKDNPWFGTENALEEFWALGFRNPWRMWLDQETGDIWLGDVGEDSHEEQNRVSGGDNGQWNYREGLARTRFDVPTNIIGNELEPLYHYPQTALSRAAIGGMIYRGFKHHALHGQYVFGDNQAGTIYTLDPQDPQSAHVIARGNQFGQLGMTSIMQDLDGEVLVTFLGRKDVKSGQIMRLMPAVQIAEKAGGSPAAAGPAKTMETKYLSVCSRCHGADGKGRSLAEMHLPQRDFTLTGWQNKVSDDYLRKVIVEGGAAVGLTPQMPAWDDYFDAEELDLLIAKIRGFSTEAATEN